MQGSTIQWLTIAWASGQSVIRSAKERVLVVKGHSSLLQTPSTANCYTALVPVARVAVAMLALSHAMRSAVGQN